MQLRKRGVCTLPQAVRVGRSSKVAAMSRIAILLLVLAVHAATAVNGQTPERPRVFLLVIDDLHLDFRDTPRVRKVLQDLGGSAARRTSRRSSPQAPRASGSSRRRAFPACEAPSAASPATAEGTRASRRGGRRRQRRRGDTPPRVGQRCHDRGGDHARRTVVPGTAHDPVRHRRLRHAPRARVPEVVRTTKEARGRCGRLGARPRPARPTRRRAARRVARVRRSHAGVAADAGRADQRHDRLLARRLDAALAREWLRSSTARLHAKNSISSGAMALGAHHVVLPVQRPRRRARQHPRDRRLRVAHPRRALAAVHHQRRHRGAGPEPGGQRPPLLVRRREPKVVLQGVADRRQLLPHRHQRA